ncbi:DUF2125 domain-containing protein [Falsihalocynthiibacter sp. S25ZX9]|uniref:DUF2125 domain-containing protein n=1 Tax=Falsihalocynthiibacter sp. S25ZX9 TaxID=3240870 RepID=UPI00350FE15A
MTYLKIISVATATSALLSSAVFADVTSEQVWNDLKTTYENLGYSMDVGSESQDGETLNIADIVLTVPVEDDESVVVTGLSFGFEQLSDGTVSIHIPDELPIMAEVDDVVVTLLLTSQDMSIIASGDDTTTNYDFSATTYALALKDIKQGDVAFSPKALVTFSELAGSYAFTKGSLFKMVGTFDVAETDIEVDIKDPEGGAQMVTAMVNLKGFTEAFDYAIPEEINYEDLAAAFAAGFGGNISFGHSGATFDIVVTDESEGFDLKGSTAEGSAKYALSQGGLGVETSSKGTQVTIVPAQMPLPISFSVEETNNVFTMPVSKSDTPDDVGLTMKLIGLSVDEALWSMIDPAGTLPHDPATLIVDLSGKLNLDFDLFDFEEAEEMSGDEFPGELHSFNIDALQLTLAGAEFTGDGAFTFNNDDLETFDGLPAPTGALNLKLVGGNALLDKLVAMGLIPEEQAMGARMMTGLFANAGEGEDELVSKIEVNADGSILANGQRIK